MQTRTLVVDPFDPDPALIAQAGDLILRGDVVAFPTETVYGLGASASNARAVGKIFTAKGRPATNPLIVHVASAREVDQVASEFPEMAQRLAERFWPGPLTLILPRAEAIPRIVTAGGDTVAVRVPRHPVALALLRAVGVPIAAPSANQSTLLSPTRAEHVLRSLSGRIPLLLDGGPTPGGIESTVVDVHTDRPRLLRPGLIPVAQLESIVGPLALAAGDSVPQGPDRSPGLSLLHYAPRTPLECSLDGWHRAQHLLAQGRRVGLLTLSTRPVLPVLPGLMVLELPENPDDYAAGLFASLHTLDEAGLDLIVVSWPPDTPEWLAVRDRLRRAIH